MTRMTAFANLGSGLQKEAMAFLRGAHNFARNGLWKTLAGRTSSTSAAGRLARMFHNPITDKSTLLSKGLTGYGLAGMAGMDLPGSHLAFNMGTPLLGALYSAPSLVTAARANTDYNKGRLKEDLMTGARAAGSDTLTLGHTDPRFLTQPGAMQAFLQKQDPATAALTSQYRSGSYQPMGDFRKLQALFSDPQALIDSRVDGEIYSLMPGMRKAGNVGRIATSLLGRLGNRVANSAVGRATRFGTSHVLPWVFPAVGVGALGHAVAQDKPYDEASAQSRGYAAAQARIQSDLGNLSGVERFALNFDPSLAADKLEQALPGTINTWQQQNGRQYQPGTLSNLTNSWKKGGDTNYYSYDATGTRRYL